MRRITVKAVRTGLAFALLASAFPAHAKWLRADTRNFIIYSEGSESTLKGFAENLQRFDAVLRARFQVPETDDSSRLVIYLVPSASDAGRLATGKNGSSIAGFYTATPEGTFAVSHREGTAGPEPSEAQLTLFHEYTHHFMKRYLAAGYPAWFIEGFAEYYSTVNFDRQSRVETGRPAHHRAYGLLAMPQIPAQRILTEKPRQMRDGGQVDVYYGRSWLLTHMLYNKPERRGQLGTYISAINRGIGAEQAAVDAFGDLAQLDKDLNGYVKRKLTSWRTNDAMAVPGEIRVGAVAADIDALIPLQLERLSAGGDKERLTKIRDALKIATARAPDNAGLWYELAAAEWALDDEEGNRAVVRAALDKAISRHSTHVRANVLLGKLISDEKDEKGDYSVAAWREARRPIMLANRTDPDDPIPLFAYYRSFAEQGSAPPEIAIDGLARAFELAPENIEVRINFAFALANEGRFDDALKLAKAVAFDPHDRGEGQNLLDQIETLRERRADHAAAEEADEAAASAD